MLSSLRRFTVLAVLVTTSVSMVIPQTSFGYDTYDDSSSKAWKIGLGVAIVGGLTAAALSLGHSSKDSDNNDSTYIPSSYHDTDGSGSSDDYNWQNDYTGYNNSDDYNWRNDYKGYNNSNNWWDKYSSKWWENDYYSDKSSDAQSSNSKSKVSKLTVTAPMIPSSMKVGETKELDYVLRNNGSDSIKLGVFIANDIESIDNNNYTDSTVRDHSVANDCGNTLAANSSCVARLIVHPTKAEDISQVLILADYSSSTVKLFNEQIVIPVNHQNISDSLEVTEPQRIYDININETKELNYELNNNTDKDLDIKIDGFSGDVTRDESVRNNCSGQLSANSRCNVRLKVTPRNDKPIRQKMSVSSGSSIYFASPIVLQVHSLEIIKAESTQTTSYYPSKSPEFIKIKVKNHSNRYIKTDIDGTTGLSSLEIDGSRSSCANGVNANSTCIYSIIHNYPSQIPDKNNDKIITSVLAIKYSQNYGDDSLHTVITSSYYPKAGLKEYLKVLGLSETEADCKAVKKAYKNIAIANHPDKTMNTTKSNSDFANINNAYDTLVEKLGCKK